MKGEKNWTRHEYETALRDLRQGSTVEWLQADGNYSDHVIEAADYSYQAATYRVHGWESDMRRKRFHEIQWRVLTGSEEIPF